MKTDVKSIINFIIHLDERLNQLNILPKYMGIGVIAYLNYEFNNMKKSNFLFGTTENDSVV